MKKRTLRAPSPALVVALIALFVALGGTSYAAINALPKNSVGTKQLKNNAVTGSKIKNGAVTAGKIDPSGLIVPNATHATSADSATSATNATNATHATSADSATTAGSAPPSGAAGGGLAGTYPNPTLAAPEAWHEIGAAGQPAFQNSWVNESPLAEVTAAFFKDPFGVVHLKGIISSGTDNVIFTLPAGYRPSKALGQNVYRNSGFGFLIVYADGTVVMSSGTGSATLDGFTFTAGE